MLKKRTMEILVYIRNYIIANGYSPTAYEIAGEFEIGVVGVEHQLGILRNAGYITQTAHWRTVYLTTKSA